VWCSVKSRVLCNGTGLAGADVHLYDDDAIAFGTTIGSHVSVTMACAHKPCV